MADRPAALVAWSPTVLAATLGGAVLGDALNRVIVIRSTVKPYEKSPPATSEDRERATPSVINVHAERGADGVRPAATPSVAAPPPERDENDVNATDIDVAAGAPTSNSQRPHWERTDDEPCLLLH